MRVLPAAMMLLLVAAGQGFARGTTTSSSNPAAPAISPEDAHAGCLHIDLRRCMISLGSALWFEMDLAAKQIARRNELDVNGNTAHRWIFIDAKLLHHRETFRIKLTLASPAPNDEVVKVRLIPPADPDLAHTASEYDRTQLYDVVSVVMGGRCPSLDKMALYQFYENSIKPLEKPKIETRADGPYHWARSTVDTAPASFCGAMFSVHRASDWQGPYLGPVRPDETIVQRSKGLLAIDIE